MNIIHLVSYNTGGAAKAAIRLNDALNANNIDSKLATIYYSNTEKNMISMSNNMMTKLMCKILKKMNNLIK